MRDSRGTGPTPAPADQHPVGQPSGAMTRIEAPESGMGEHIDWALLRPKMAAGMGKLSEAVYGNSQLPVREREAARWTIALINDCAVCRDTRARDGEAVGAGEPFYAQVTDWRSATDLS